MSFTACVAAQPLCTDETAAVGLDVVMCDDARGNEIKYRLQPQRAVLESHLEKTCSFAVKFYKAVYPES